MKIRTIAYVINKGASSGQRKERKLKLIISLVKKKNKKIEKDNSLKLDERPLGKK